MSILEIWTYLHNANFPGKICACFVAYNFLNDNQMLENMWRQHDLDPCFIQLGCYVICIESILFSSGQRPTKLHSACQSCHLMPVEYNLLDKKLCFYTNMSEAMSCSFSSPDSPCGLDGIGPTITPFLACNHDMTPHLVTLGVSSWRVGERG